MGYIITAIVIALVIALVTMVVSMYNRFIRLRNNAREAFSTMDTYLTKRFDLIPNLVETAKGYAKHETEAFEKVIQARNMVQASGNMEQKLAGENMLSGTLKSLFAVMENYPELKADAHFLQLQRQLETVESEILNSRKYYNGTVKMLNNAIEMFPSNIIAGIFHFEKMPLYEVSDEAKRENVQVKF